MTQVIELHLWNETQQHLRIYRIYFPECIKMWMSEDLIEEKSTLVQAAVHYVDQISQSDMTP